MGFENIIESFILGLLTPLTAVCVLPLYPGFLSFLSSKFSPDVSKKTYALFGAVISLGVIVFMLLFGLIFTTLLGDSLTKWIGIISPIAFGILGVVSLLLIFDYDFSKFIPKPKTSTEGNPLKSGFVFGFFFGAIVLPCNPGFIALFLARTTLVQDFVGSMSNFLAFGIGLSAPLLLFSLVTFEWSSKIIGFMTKYKTWINRIAGLIMLGISIYYLFFVFKIV
jgi:cytochrome c-type biogenesis protein